MEPELLRNRWYGRETTRAESGARGRLARHGHLQVWTRNDPNWPTLIRHLESVEYEWYHGTQDRPSNSWYTVVRGISQHDLQRRSGIVINKIVCFGELCAAGIDGKEMNKRRLQFISKVAAVVADAQDSGFSQSYNTVMAEQTWLGYVTEEYRHRDEI